MPDLRLVLDVEMKDADSMIKSDKSNVTYSASTGADIRSPRTPTYAPKFPTMSLASAFDPSRLFSYSETKLSKAARQVSMKPSPVAPLAWIWQCHLCKSRYPLGATRRCLQDGHFYCSGETDRPNLRKRKGQSCSSEFDYVGWKEWGAWKRSILGARENESIVYSPTRGCEKCDFPSQCRHERASQSYSRSSSLGTGDGANAKTKLDSGRSSSGTVSGSVTFDSIFASEDESMEEMCTESAAATASPEPTSTSPAREANKKPTISTGDRVGKPLKRENSKKSPLSPILEEHLPKTGLKGLEASIMEHLNVKGTSESQNTSSRQDRWLDFN